MLKVRLRLLWFPQAQFAGALLAEHSEIAMRHGINLECQPVKTNESPISAVLSGRADLCVASPSHILESDDPKSLVCLLTFQQASSLVYLIRRDHGVDGIHCLAGKRIAVWPGSEDLELNWMLHKAGVSSGDIEFVPTKDTVQLLLAGEVSCAQMTTYNEYFEFLECGGRLTDVLCLSARDWDADLIKDGIIARKDWLEADPARAQAAVNSLLEGWTRALDNANEAIELCAKIRPDVDKRFHWMQFNEIRKLIVNGATLSHGLGFPDSRHVLQAAKAVSDLHGLEFKDSIDGFVAVNFWRSADPSFRRSRW